MVDESRIERLQKLLARCGYGSRRHCERIIIEGRVTVDGQVVTTLGATVDPVRSRIAVDGSELVVSQTRRYLVINKPAGVVSTMRDPCGRPCLSDLLAPQDRGLFHVRRLETDTEGALLLTNDGTFAEAITSPLRPIEKEYLAEVDGRLPLGAVSLPPDVQFSGTSLHVRSCSVVASYDTSSLMDLIVLDDGNHVVRRFFAATGHPVLRLVRTRVGPVRLGDLPLGTTRPLTNDEIDTLWATGWQASVGQDAPGNSRSS